MKKKSEFKPPWRWLGLLKIHHFCCICVASIIRMKVLNSWSWQSNYSVTLYNNWSVINDPVIIIQVFLLNPTDRKVSSLGSECEIRKAVVNRITIRITLRILALFYRYWICVENVENNEQRTFKQWWIFISVHCFII